MMPPSYPNPWSPQAEVWPWPVPPDSIIPPDMTTTIAGLNQILANLIAAMQNATLFPVPKYVIDGVEFDRANFLKILGDAMKLVMQMRQMFGTVKIAWLGRRPAAWKGWPFGGPNPWSGGTGP